MAAMNPMSEPDAPYRATMPPWGLAESLAWYVYRGPDMVWIFGRSVSDASSAFLSFHEGLGGELSTYRSDSSLNETLRAWTPIF